MLWVLLWKLWMTETDEEKQGFARGSFKRREATYEISRVQTCAAGHKMAKFYLPGILKCG